MGVENPYQPTFLLLSKTKVLLDIDVKLFNRVVFEYLKTTDYPVGKLDTFPLIENDEVVVRILSLAARKWGRGLKHTERIPFEVDGKSGTILSESARAAIFVSTSRR